MEGTDKEAGKGKERRTERREEKWKGKEGLGKGDEDWKRKTRTHGIRNGRE